MLKRFVHFLLPACFLYGCTTTSVTDKKNAAPVTTATNTFQALRTCYVTNDLFTELQPDSVKEKIATPDALRQKMIADIEKRVATGSSGKSAALLKGLAASNRILVQCINVSPVLKAYILHIDDTSIPNEYRIYLMDNKGGITNEPFLFYGSNMQDDQAGFAEDIKMLEKPLFRVADIDSDGKQELIFKERLHNGNGYNAVKEHYLNYDAALTLTEKFQLETAAFLPFDTTSNMLTRTISYKKGSCLYTISCFLEEGKKKPPVFVGEIMASPDNGKWHPIRKTVQDRDYANMLLTCKPEGDGELMK